ncbi:MAG TPA: hypothetical protein VG890_08680 [Puia sp.]|nr:hypothetical protein [Puia sp.]
MSASALSPILTFFITNGAFTKSSKMVDEENAYFFLQVFGCIPAISHCFFYLKDCGCNHDRHYQIECQVLIPIHRRYNSSAGTREEIAVPKHHENVARENSH